MHLRHETAALLAGVMLTSSGLSAATPTVTQALKLVPIQKNVQYDSPSAEDAKSCTLKAERQAKGTAWVLRDAQGQTLRTFADSNGDNKVDQWRYYQHGLEVYRDVDANFNNKADQYRWFHTSGCRWGLDTNEDGRVDRWKLISAPEVAAEMVAALGTNDEARFRRLLVTPNELKGLGMGKARTQQVQKQLKSALDQFRKLSNGQKKITGKSKFVQFGVGSPGLIPQGTDGSTKDIIAYENAVALTADGSDYGQVHMGTVLRVGETWRLIDAPSIDGPSRGIFSQAPLSQEGQSNLAGGTAPSEEVQKLMSDLSKLDGQAAEALPSDQASIHKRRTRVLEQLAEKSHGEQREQWIRQLADTISVAVQAGGYPNGVKRLKSLEKQLGSTPSDRDLLAYVGLRHITAIYAHALAQPKAEADFAKIQANYLEALQAFVDKYPKNPQSAEALLQVAMGHEFAGEIDDATKAYGQIVRQFASAAPANKARGAKRRLESPGKSISLRGKGINGGDVDLSKLREKIVLVQYWATWCEPCKVDMAQIKELVSRYGARGFAVVGVNLDSSRQLALDYLKTARLPWPQIHEPGGLDSQPAVNMGILTLPTMLLVDKQGHVINRNIHVTELEGELKRLVE